MNITKILKPLSICTGVLTAIVYIDILFFYGVFFFTIPLAVLTALVTIIFALFKKSFGIVLINLILAVIAVLSIVVFPW